MYFNILASGLGDSQFYDRKEIMDWKQRFPLVLKEIQRYDCHIVCLCECNHFEDYWVGAMKQLGYTSFVRVAKNISPCARYPFSFSLTQEPPDGSVIFVRERFKIAQNLSFCCQDTKPVGMCVLIDRKAFGRKVVVGVTHLKAFEDHWRKRMLEIDEGVKAIERLSKRGKLSSLPAIFGGDWNEEERGGVEKVVKASKLDLVSSHDSYHPLYTAMDLKATWNTKRRIEGVPWGGFRGMLDYVYYSRNSFALVGVAKEPKFQDIVNLHKQGNDYFGIPNCHYPSDHVAQVCEFEWMGKAYLK